jgi:threonine 3-dehydrogenase
MNTSLVKELPETGLWEKKLDSSFLGPDEVKIKVEKTGICGTDLHIYNWDQWSQDNVKLGSTIGHEFFGHVAAVGSNVQGFDIGEKVTAEGHIFCGKCRQCKSQKAHLCTEASFLGINFPGAYAEYVTVPACNVVRLGDVNVPGKVLSILDPLGNAVHAVDTLDRIGEHAIIAGAGPVGLMAAMILKYTSNARITITDQNPYRLELAQSLGVDHAINMADSDADESLQDLGKSYSFTSALEMSGSDKALADIINHIEPGSQMIAFGLSKEKSKIDWNQVVTKGLDIRGVFGRKIFDTWDKTLALLKAGMQFDPLITHEYDACNHHQAFSKLLSGQASKVIMDWS